MILGVWVALLLAVLIADKAVEERARELRIGVEIRILVCLPLLLDVEGFVVILFVIILLGLEVEGRGKGSRIRASWIRSYGSFSLHVLIILV